MTIIVERLIFCDGGEDCPRTDPGNNDGAKQISAAAVRFDAARNGWVNRGNKDYCEACAKRLNY